MDKYRLTEAIDLLRQAAIILQDEGLQARADNARKEANLIEHLLIIAHE
jgi:hypothetical protein